MKFKSVFAVSAAVLLLSACDALQQIAQEVLTQPPPGQPGQPPTGQPGPPPTGQPGQPGAPPPVDPTPPPPSGNQGQPPIYAIGPSLQDLDTMASQLLQYDQTGRSLSGGIVDDRNQSGGVAAIGYRGNEAMIYVHPDRRREWSYNTWAFIIGHELSHALYQHRGGPEDEWAADRHGANMAAAAGYDVSEYIAFICSEQPNSCSASHGCFHDRMRALEDQFNVSACTSDTDHHGHGLALGMGALGTPPADWTGTCVFELPE